MKNNDPQDQKRVLVIVLEECDSEPLCVNCNDKGCDFCGPVEENKNNDPEHPF